MASILKIIIELLTFLKYLQITKAKTSSPPVVPPPKKVIAQPAPTNAPPNIEASRIDISL